MDLIIIWASALVLVACGVNGRYVFVMDESLFENDFNSTVRVNGLTSTQTARECTVNGMAGACVESRVYCITPHGITEVITSRSKNPCRNGVCCKHSDVILRRDASVGTATATNPTASSTTPTSSLISRLSPNISAASDKEGCGWRNPQGIGPRTTDDADVANFGEFPWMVIIFTMIPQSSGEEISVALGGGSLIQMKVVLTTAHYVAKANKLKVRAGDWNIMTTSEMYLHQDRDVDAVEIHKDFNRGTLYYDAALLFLNKPIDPSPNIGVACLPPPKRLQQEGTKCFTSGWGKHPTAKGRYQGTLKKVEVPVLNHTTCQNLLRNTRLRHLFHLHRSFMCAGGEPGKDACKSDGGSPLVCPMELEPDRFVQAGMVAWGIGCGGDGTPGVYVDVSVVRDWIDDKIAGRGLGDEMVYARY